MMTGKERLTLTWEKDNTADRYVIRQQMEDGFKELVRIENPKLTNIIVPDIESGIETHFRVEYYKKEMKTYIKYKEQDFYCFVKGRLVLVYKFPVPKLISAIKTDESVTVSWEKVDDEVYYLVMKKLKGESWEKICITKNTKYIDRCTQKKYIYTVRCVSEDGKENMSGCSLRGISY